MTHLLSSSSNLSINSTVCYQYILQSLLLPFLKRFCPLPPFFPNFSPRPSKDLFLFLPLPSPYLCLLPPFPLPSTTMLLPSPPLLIILTRLRFILNEASWDSLTSAAPNLSMRAFLLLSISSEVTPLADYSSIAPNLFIRSCFFTSIDSLVSMPKRSCRCFIRTSDSSFVTMPKRSALASFFAFYSSISCMASRVVAAAGMPVSLL